MESPSPWSIEETGVFEDEFGADLDDFDVDIYRFFVEFDAFCARLSIIRMPSFL